MFLHPVCHSVDGGGGVVQRGCGIGGCLLPGRVSLWGMSARVFVCLGGDESVEFAVKLVERQRFDFISTTFIHTQLHSMIHYFYCQRYNYN